MNGIKKNHHYVPKFWLRLFASDKGQLYGWDGLISRKTSVDVEMTQEWLYTLFDNAWNPSNALEDELSKFEGTAAHLFKNIDGGGEVSADARRQLCYFLGLQACRHPKVMNDGRRVLKDFLALMSLAPDMGSESEFLQMASGFAITEHDARALYALLMSMSRSTLLQGIESLTEMSPQHFEFPEQEVIRATAGVGGVIDSMELSIIEAPTDCSFVLGDVPLPQRQLGAGFSVPISKRVAVVAKLAHSPAQTIERKQATPSEVVAVNRMQWSNAQHVVVGPSRSVFKSIWVVKKDRAELCIPKHKQCVGAAADHSAPSRPGRGVCNAEEVGKLQLERTMASTDRIDVGWESAELLPVLI